MPNHMNVIVKSESRISAKERGFALGDTIRIGR
jgi:hypothetical protein